MPKAREGVGGCRRCHMEVAVVEGPPLQVMKEENRPDAKPEIAASV